MRDFPPIIDAGHICHFVTCYETYNESCFAIINDVCYYFKLFVWPLSLAVILKSDPVVVIALKN